MKILSFLPSLQLRHSILCLFLVCAGLLSCESPDVPPQAPPADDADSSGAVEDVPDTTDVSDEPVPDWEDALTAVRNMKVGWNLGNTLDSHDAAGTDGDDWLKWETYWGQPQTRPELMHMLKAAGFDAVRVPVTWGIHMDAAGQVHPSWMNRVHEIVDYVIDAGMYCILNVHHDTGAGEGAWLIADPLVYEEQKSRYEGLWKQIAEEFSEYGEKLLFESYNEMLDSRRSWCFASFNGGYDEAFAMDAYKAINSYAGSFVNAVRSTGGNNSVRNLVVNTYGACCGTGNWNQHLKDPLIYMELPEDKYPGHIAFEVHVYPSVKDLNAAKAEVDDMFMALNTHLVSKGAPVIVGEWGTSNDNGESDYLVRRENVLEFAEYFVRKAKELDMGTFHWMGISDGVARSIPVFSQPDLAQTIVEAWHGDGFSAEYPTWDDYDCTYLVTYSSLWSELNLIQSALDADVYSGVRLVLDEAPETGRLQVKLYGDDKEHYPGIPVEKETFIPIEKSEIGSHCRRMTLQYMKESLPYSIRVRKAVPVRRDGTEEASVVSPFWGCTVELEASPKVR